MIMDGPTFSSSSSDGQHDDVVMNRRSFDFEDKSRNVSLNTDNQDAMVAEAMEECLQVFVMIVGCSLRYT